MTTHKQTLALRRKQAKVGMAAALGVLVGTGFAAQSRAGGTTGTARLIHTAAGVALVGFSYWHWSLYRKTTSGGGGKS